ncbi:hypothetical protein Syun_022408 [Stephania yunnanensis]|uniref:F-box/LRR-repeat protein 15/At3g58940/PEG3-like LRR domain-containing protein n=1 Tax=Stephania yunnanensis TaxID=152371 RepID=A0AAP0FE00_9MAGN
MFMNFVDNVLLRHDISNLHCFKLGCFGICDISRVHSWISTVAHSKLRELYLKIYELDSNVIPMSVYCCESLVVLKISFLGSKFNPPTSISLPSLKTLILNSLSFVDDDHELMQQFFSSLPALQHLILLRCRFHDYKKLIISSTSLNSLRIENSNFEPFYRSDPVIKVCAPQLRDLYFETSTPAREYILSSMPVLQEAYISAPAYRDPTNLTYLELFGCYDGPDILRLLQVMPNLQHLIFNLLVSGSSEDDLTLYIGEMLPPCFHSKIKEIQISEYGYLSEDFPMMNFLLNNIEDLKITENTYSTDSWGDEIKTIRLVRDSLDS